MKLLAFLALVTISSAYVIYEPQYYVPAPLMEEYRRVVKSPEESIYADLEPGSDDFEDFESVHRERRSLQPGAPNFPMPGQQLPTSVGTNIEKQGKNTIATINAQHKTDRYDVGATWTKVIRGPGKSKPNWNVGGTYRW